MVMQMLRQVNLLLGVALIALSITAASTLFSSFDSQRLLDVRRPQKMLLIKKFRSNEEVITET